MRLTESKLRAVIRESVRQILSESMDYDDFSRMIDSLYDYDAEELESMLEELDNTGTLSGSDLPPDEIEAVRSTIMSRLKTLNRPTTVIWVDGPVDQMWVKKRLDHYAGMGPSTLLYVMNDFTRMLEGEDMDAHVVEIYTNSDGTSNVSRQTMEAFVRGLERLVGR